jgi:hypothetical protein
MTTPRPKNKKWAIAQQSCADFDQPMIAGPLAIARRGPTLMSRREPPADAAVTAWS